MPIRCSAFVYHRFMASLMGLVRVKFLQATERAVPDLDNVDISLPRLEEESPGN